MPVPKSEFDDLRSLEFRDPDEVLDPDELYTVYEIARLFQGLDPGQDIDPETEAILLDWTIPWIRLWSRSPRARRGWGPRH